MKRIFSLCFALFALMSAVFADDEVKQNVMINGVSTGKQLKTITFDGGNANLTFIDGTTETVNIDAVVIAFESSSSSISISTMQPNGETKAIYDINGHQLRQTLDSLPKGVYIIKSADKAVKFVKN